MKAFTYQDGVLHAEGVSLEELAATYGTPLYVYSENAFLDQYRTLDKAFGNIDHLICYSVKTNGNLSVIKTLAKAGSGADVVSGGELVRARTAGIPAKKIVFAGVGKTREEMALGIREGIAMFNAESVAELAHLNEVAGRLKKKARVALRVNPDVKAKTHKKITTGHKESKFGIPFAEAKQMVANFGVFKHLQLTGLHCHIGSQLLDPAPYGVAIEKVLTLLPVAEKAGQQLKTFNLGGGFGIRYKDEKPPSFAAFARVIVPLVKPTGLKLLMEPGRSIAGNSGVLVTKVMYTKQGGKRFTIVDAAMNDLARPAMYDAYHEVGYVRRKTGTKHVTDVVGPVCESSDVLAAARPMQAAHEGDLIAIHSAGAYGFAMASTYNARPRPAEVMVKGKKHRLIGKRETVNDLMRLEKAYL